MGHWLPYISRVESYLNARMGAAGWLALATCRAEHERCGRAEVRGCQVTLGTKLAAKPKPQVQEGVRNMRQDMRNAQYTS